LCSLEGEYLTDSEWMDLRVNYMLFFLKNLEVIMSKFKSKFCKSL